MLEKTYVTCGAKEDNDKQGIVTKIWECYHSEELNKTVGKEFNFYKPLFKEFEKALEVMNYHKQVAEDSGLEIYKLVELDGWPAVMENYSGKETLFAKIEPVVAEDGNTYYGVGHETLGWYQTDSEGKLL